jgi:uncharacterized protein with GYD domain
MVTYVLLLNFTDQGIRTVKETVKRAKAFRDLVKKHGGTVQSFYWTQGGHDIVTIVEVPNEESGMAILLTLGLLGNVRSQTLRAFTDEEMTRILAAVG